MAEQNYLTKTFWQQFVASLVRFVLFAVGAWLTQKGIISAEQAEGFSSWEVAMFLGGGVLLAAPVWW